MERREINEKKKEYLNKYHETKKREKRILDEIERLRMDKMYPSLVINDMPHTTGHNDLSDYMVKVDEQIQKLNEELSKKAGIYEDITRRIGKLKSGDEQDVLFLRYISGMKWEEIAVKMEYSHKHIYKIYGRALNNFEI